MSWRDWDDRLISGVIDVLKCMVGGRRAGEDGGGHPADGCCGSSIRHGL